MPCLFFVYFTSFTPEPVEVNMKTFRSCIFEISQKISNQWLFFIHFETLVLSRLKLLQIFIDSSLVAPSFFFWITSALNRASCFIRLRLIFGSSDVKSIVALDLEPSFNEHVKEVEGSADQETVVET